MPMSPGLYYISKCLFGCSSRNRARLAKRFVPQAFELGGLLRVFNTPPSLPPSLSLSVLMVVLDMRAVRGIYAQRNLRIFSNQSLPSSPTLLSYKPSQNPNFPRRIHSANRLLREQSSAEPDVLNERSGSASGTDDTIPENERDPGVYTVYDPATGRIVTRRGAAKSEASNGDGDGPGDRWSSGRGFGVVRGANLGFREVGGSRKKKTRFSWVCSDCGYSDGQWWGSCRACNGVGTLKKFVEGEPDERKKSGFEVAKRVVGSWLAQKSAEAVPVRLMDVNRGINISDWRIPLPGLFGMEVARVLGGGLVPGSLVLVGGDPGVGKSTLLLQSVEQIGNRADRMSICTEELFLYSSTDIEDILDKVQALSPRALIVDSIQTVYLMGVTGSAGGLSQVKECTSALLRYAKKTNIPVLLIGHVNKSGDIAGPRVLEHIVDVVLYMEGEKHSSHRLLRSVKNRFGSTDELGVFEMSQAGLQAVSNPSEMFLTEQQSDSEFLAGLAIAVIMDGSRSFLIEIQALCVPASLSASRHVNGVQSSRADMIVSVLKRQAGLKLQDNGIFLNVVSGVALTETAGDLAIAAAICSSFLEFPIPNNVAFIGEIGLAGELRTVPRMEKRVNTVAKLGYKTCIVPKASEKSLAALDIQGTTILGCKNLKEMINAVFSNSHQMETS
ncbi:uncharacterized protein LOC127795430 isoform X2 [Diospyros lotus]|uniref:uncharacterized protein LOC127795430 isoform X2 n=1 Tax=Diospyros lotus TaxID=55363 RepID=UPI00224CD3D9|nr:uncharacterized protein LOC127795430 isoform X2 [Diospyros lotus]